MRKYDSEICWFLIKCIINAIWDYIQWGPVNVKILDTPNKLNLKLIYTQTTLNEGKGCFQGGEFFLLLINRFLKHQKYFFKSVFCFVLMYCWKNSDFTLW